MKKLVVQAATAVAVSILGVAVFCIVLEQFDRPRCVAEAEQRMAELKLRFDQRIASVEKLGRQFESGGDATDFLRSAMTLARDPSFVSAEWLPRVSPEKRTVFHHRVRKELGPTVSIRAATPHQSIADDEVVFPVRFTSQEDQQCVGVYRKDVEALHAAIGNPQEVAVSGQAGTGRAAVTAACYAVPARRGHDRRKLRGVVAAYYRDLFAPRFEHAVYPRTDLSVYQVLHDKRILVSGRTDGGTNKKLIVSDLHRGNQQYHIEVTESSHVAAKRGRFSLFGILLGPFFVCSLLRFFWQREANALESKNQLLSDEVCEYVETQQTLRSLLTLREQERRLVANEIHDGFMQEVMSAQMFLEALGSRIDDRDETAKQHLRNAQQLIDQSIGEGRQLVNELKPWAVDQYGLISALQRLISGQNDRYELTVTLRYPPDTPEIDIQCERTLYRIVQESLSNVRRHSGAKEATVSLHFDDEWVTLDVTDQGRGFEMGQVEDGNFGLSGIRERAQLCGGEAVIKSIAGEGTALTVRLPMHDSHHQRAESQDVRQQPPVASD